MQSPVAATGAPKARGTVRQCYRSHARWRESRGHSFSDQRSLLFRPCSIYPSWCDSEWLARDDPTLLCCLGKTQYWGLPKKRDSWSPGAALRGCRAGAARFWSCGTIQWLLAEDRHFSVTTMCRLAAQLGRALATEVVPQAPVVAQPGPPGSRSPDHGCHLQTGEQHREGEGEQEGRTRPTRASCAPLLPINRDFVRPVQKSEQQGPNVVQQDTTQKTLSLFPASFFIALTDEGLEFHCHCKEKKPQKVFPVFAPLLPRVKSFYIFFSQKAI